MSRKHTRSDAQVERLAAQLRDRWTAADGIMPWLRRRLPLLTRLNQNEGWSWADISRALDIAGINYGTGRPWTGFLLARKVGQARDQVRVRNSARLEKAAAPPKRPVATAPPSPARARHLRSTAPDANEQTPEFAMASLAPTAFVFSRQPTGDGSRMKKPPPNQKRVDVDAVIRRLQGGDAGCENEG